MSELTDKLSPEQREYKIKLAFIEIIEKYMDYYQCSDVRDLAYWFYKEIEPILAANTAEDEPIIKQSCEDGWHGEPNVWAYLECDCPGCVKGRTQITMRKIEEYIEEVLQESDKNCPVAREFRAIFQGCIEWLDKQKD